MTFHQLCQWLGSDGSAASGRDLLADARRAYPTGGLFEEHLPYACALAADILPMRFDAIVVDEAQDFMPEFWLPLEMLLSDPARSTMLVFYDQNQAVYRRLEGCPVSESPFVLTVNCRNTRTIHEAAYQYFRGEETDPCEIEGVPVGTLAAPGLSAQARLIHSTVAELIEKERVNPDDIAVLTAGHPAEAYYSSLSATTLPRGAKWAVEHHRVPGAVTVDTVSRFKGLEAAVVVLWGVDDLDSEADREAIYVGLSRAKSRLFLAGSAERCAAALQRS